MGLEIGHRGQFDVLDGDTVVASRNCNLLYRTFKGFGWPEAGQVVEILRSRGRGR